MTKDKSFIFLRRLVIITHLGKVAYDEKFHKGVNVIRGQNSSGKSTISNFIFYALGGDYSNWNAESLKCREVFAEIEISGGIYTLKRGVSTSSRQPMNIFWGTFEKASQDNINWKTFSYLQTGERSSFTNILFNALNFPEVKGENDSNITMHQMLRLLYIDQESPTQCLFRREVFDFPITREAISELLLGVYDDTLYTERLSLKKAEKDYLEKKKEFESLNKVYLSSGNAITNEELNKNIEKANNELNKAQSEITKTKETQSIRLAKNSSIRVEKVQKELIEAKQSLKNINSRTYNLELDIVDSRNFIETIEKRILDIENSILTKKTLGEIPLELCPQCLTPLKNHVPEGHCSLCKQPFTTEEEITHAKRLKQELELQVKESKNLLTRKEAELLELKGKAPEMKVKTIQLQKELDFAIKESQSTRDNRLDDLLIQKGGIEKQIEYLTQQLQGISQLERLKKELAELSLNIESYKLSILQREANQEKNKEIALKEINKIAVSILHSDLKRQKEFHQARRVEIDFFGDSISLDGNFNFSASSNTYLKNAVRFAIFFSSLNIDFMRYPKFILCDNVEDKGMEKERSQNFQNVITNLSSNKVEHQIIFTTSMISDELEGTPYCVGEYYSESNKTLKL